MHKHSPRLFRGDYSLYIRAKLTSIVNHHDSYIGFCCVYLKDEFMSVKIKHTLVGNPVTVNIGLVLLSGPCEEKSIVRYGGCS